MLKIKINGTEISVENSVPSDDLSIIDFAYQRFSSESDMISKQIKTITLLSDVKTVESFGYKSSENVAQTMVEAVKKLWQKIIDFIKKIINFITSVIQGTIIKVRVNKLLEKINSSAVFAASADFQIEWPIKTIDELNNYSLTVKKYLPIIKSANNSDELKELFVVSGNLSKNAYTESVSVDEAFKRIGIKAFKGGTFGGDGINRSFSKEVHDYLMKLKNGSSEYLFQLKQSCNLSKAALKESMELARNNSDAKRANAMQASINILNKTSHMYLKYVTSVLRILETIYSVQCFAQPGTPAFEEWKVKQKRNRTILLIAGISVGLAAGGATVALANPALAAAAGNTLTGTAARNMAKNIGKKAASTSINTATKNVSKKLTNNIMDEIYKE